MAKQQTIGELVFGNCVAIALLLALAVAVACSGCDVASANDKSQCCVTMFTAKWCRKCQTDKQYLPKLEKLAGEISVVDVDEFPKMARDWNITKLPTYVVTCPSGQTFRTHDIRTLFGLYR